MKPEVGDKVRFVLGGGPNHGRVRTAIVTAQWQGDAAASARKVGKSLEEFERTDGMRLTLDIHAVRADLLGYEYPPGKYGIRFSVTHAEYDPTGQTPGTWHSKQDYLKRRFPNA